MRSKWLTLQMLALVGCMKSTPIVTVLPPQMPDAGRPNDAGAPVPDASDCEQLCKHTCPGWFGDAGCQAGCENLSAAGISTDLACLARSASCDAGLSCFH